MLHVSTDVYAVVGDAQNLIKNTFNNINFKNYTITINLVKMHAIYLFRMDEKKKLYSLFAITLSRLRMGNKKKKNSLLFISNSVIFHFEMQVREFEIQFFEKFMVQYDFFFFYSSGF
jgi:hypothetical protein